MSHQPQTVLLVDDDPAVRRYLRSAIEKLGYEVCTASDGESFKQAFRRSKADIILLDLIIPGSDSIELLKFLAASHCTVPVLLMSGLDSQTIDVASKLGAAHGLRMIGGLEKPFDSLSLELGLEKAGREKGDLAEEDLMGAIERGDLRVYYQPQVDAGDGHLIGAEALLRWQHPEYGVLLPGYFLPLARAPEVLSRLTRWVSSAALAQLAQWRQLGAHMTMSINLFANDISHADFPEWLEECVAENHVEARQVVLELTERATAADLDLTREVMTRLRLRGFQMSIDDFGTGYSSFAMLQQLPFNELKIDKSFVMEALAEPSSRTIVEALTGLGSSLGLRVVAEGIEDEPTLKLMQSLGLSVIQGYYTGRPMPGQSFMRGLQRTPVERRLA